MDEALDRDMDMALDGALLFIHAIRKAKLEQLKICNGSEEVESQEAIDVPSIASSDIINNNNSGIGIDTQSMSYLLNPFARAIHFDATSIIPFFLRPIKATSIIFGWLGGAIRQLYFWNKHSESDLIEFVTLDDDTMVHISRFLDPIDLVHIALTCKHFGARRNTADRSTWSLVEETARKIVERNQKAGDRDRLPRRHSESWISIRNQLKLLRAPLQFDQLLGAKDERGKRIEGWQAVVYTNKDDKSEVSLGRSMMFPYGTAISNHAMRAGIHATTFTRTGDDRFEGSMCVGIMRQIKGWDRKDIDLFHPCVNRNFDSDYRNELLAERTEQWGDGKLNCVMYDMDKLAWRSSDWVKGNKNRTRRVKRRVYSDVVTLLLDLDKGILSVFAHKDGKMKLLNAFTPPLLSGEYCWAASMCQDRSIRIKRTPRKKHSR